MSSTYQGVPLFWQYRTNALIRNPETSEKQQFWTNTFKVALDDYLMTLPDTPPQ